MDENYLDNLLNEFTLDKDIDHKLEDELDEQIEQEKRKRQEEETLSREDAFNLDLELDAESGMPEGDVEFSESQMDELDQLDNFADMDIGDLDFSDIDFDDLDITKLSDDISDDDFDDLLKDFEGDLQIPDFISPDDKTQAAKASEDEDLFEATEQFGEDGAEKSEEAPDPFPEDEKTVSLEEASGQGEPEADSASDHDFEDHADLNEDSFDADSFLDSLLDEEASEKQKDSPIQDLPENGEDSESDDSLDDLLGGESDDMGDQSSSGKEEGSGVDDLFSMLDLDESENEDAAAHAAASPAEMPGEGLDIPEGLDDIEELPEEKPKKKKKTLMEILFGEPDEDDEPTEEELKAKAEKKAAKAAKKEADKEKKAAQAEKAKADKSKKDADKKRQDAEKKRVKAEKKAKKKAAADAEAKNAEPEKKLNKPVVIFIFSVFIGGVGFLYLSSVDFNYKLAIKNAADYFSSQKYRMAYDEIKGVDVKEKDKELKERIYTVMYVERLYEAYNNNIELGRQRKALDSLLRGVEKYYEYYDEAQELNIVLDLEYSFAQIQSALQDNYGISLDRALEINEMDDYEYMKTIEEYTAGMTAEEE